MRAVSQSVHPRSPGKLVGIGNGDASYLIAAPAVQCTELNLPGLHSPKLALVSTIGDVQPSASWHSLKHFLHPRQTHIHLHALLTPNGTLLIAVPNPYESQAHLPHPNWPALDVPRHLHHFSSQYHQTPRRSPPIHPGIHPPLSPLGNTSE